MLDPLLFLAPILDPILDPLTVRATRAIQSLLRGPPLRAEHARSRERTLARVLEKYRSQPFSEQMIENAIAELREEGAAETSFERAAHALDRVVHRNQSEWLDDPSFDERLRLRTLERLDRMNEAIGAYEAFFTAIEPAIARAHAAGVARPAVVDLASGHAMFAVALALRFGAREGRVRVIATDLAPEYLEIGRKKALALAMRDDVIDFRTQDALDLSNLGSEERVDVVTCTQTLHHFPEAMVSRLFAAAARVARHGAVLVDGERNPFAVLLITGIAAAIGRGSVPFLHDSFVSMRRMYTEQELALLAELSPSLPTDVKIERGWLSPGHIFIRSARTVTAGRA